MKIRNYADLAALHDLWSLAERDAMDARNAYLNALAYVDKHGFDEEHTTDSEADCLYDDPTLNCMGCGGIGHIDEVCS